MKSIQDSQKKNGFKTKIMKQKENIENIKKCGNVFNISYSIFC